MTRGYILNEFFPNDTHGFMLYDTEFSPNDT